MQRLVRVEFGPSRSKRFRKALAEAESGPGECNQLEPGRYRAGFVLDEDAAAYTGLARLLERPARLRHLFGLNDDPVSGVRPHLCLVLLFRFARALGEPSATFPPVHSSAMA